MANNLALGVVIGGAISSTVGAAFKDVEGRIKKLSDQGTKARVLQSTIGDTIRLRDEWKKAHDTGSASADGLLKKLESNLRTLKDQGVEVGKLRNEYQKLGQVARGAELKALGHTQIKQGKGGLKNSVGQATALSAAVAIPTKISGDYQAQMRQMSLWAHTAGTDDEGKMTAMVSTIADDKGMSRQLLAKAVGGLIEKGVDWQEASAYAGQIADLIDGQGMESGKAANPVDAFIMLSQEMIKRQDPAKAKKIEGLKAKIKVAADGSAEEQQAMVALTEAAGLANIVSDQSASAGLLAQIKYGDKIKADMVTIERTDGKTKIETDAAKARETSNRRWAEATAGMEASMISLGDGLRPLTDKVADGLGKVGYALADLANKYQPVTAVIAAVAAGAVTLGAALSALKIGKGLLNVGRGSLMGNPNIPQKVIVTNLPAGGLGGLDGGVDGSGKGRRGGKAGGRGLGLPKGAKLPAALAVIEAGYKVKDTYDNATTRDEKAEGYGEAAGGLAGTLAGAAAGAAIGSAVPIGVGIANTKTLAKLANHTAKRLQAQTGGVVNITDPMKRDWVLRNTDVSEVWGVGRKMKLHLDAPGIKSAMDLAKADPWTLRKKSSVVIEKTARELAGTSCLELDEPDPPKQEICCSRMFGMRLTELAPIKEAVATYMMRASEKLRAQNSLCKKVRVCIRTGMFNPEEAKYANGVVVDMPYPTDDVRLLTKAAVDALDRIFRPGFKYSKAEVMLLNLCQPGEYTDDLFAVSQPAEATRVMSVLDQINDRWGRGTLRSASVPTNPEWGMRREMMSQSYTTKLDQLWSVACK